MKTTQSREPSRPCVSVVIPTHNRAVLLRAAVDSVLRQSCTELEIIVVDDNSEDGTEHVVRQIRDPRIVYLRHPRTRGGSAARNTGIRAARGDYIAFLDDDDEWVENKLARQLAALPGFDVVLCRVRMKHSGRIYSRFKKDEIRLRDLRKGFVFGGGTSTILARADAVRSTMFDEALPCKQDWDLMVRLAQRYRIRYLREPLVLFNDGGHQRITNRPKESMEAIRSDLAAYHKHKAVLGSFWYRYQVARRLCLVKGVRRRLRHAGYALAECGLLPLVAVYVNRLTMKLLRN